MIDRASTRRPAPHCAIFFPLIFILHAAYSRGLTTRDTQRACQRVKSGCGLFVEYVEYVEYIVTSRRGRLVVLTGLESLRWKKKMRGESSYLYSRAPHRKRANCHSRKIQVFWPVLRRVDNA